MARYFVYQLIDTHFSGQQVDDLKSVLHNTHGHDLLSIVASVHHEGAGQTLYNGALGLAETLDLIASSRVRQELCILFLDGDVILLKNQREHIKYLNPH